MAQLLPLTSEKEGRRDEKRKKVEEQLKKAELKRRRLGFILNLTL